MVTWFRSQEALPVRVRALHPVLVVFAFILFGLGFTVFASASEWDLPVEEYILNTDSTLYDLVQPYSDVYRLFGVNWTYDSGSHKVTNVSSISSDFNKLDVGDQFVLTAVLDTFLGVNDAINAQSITLLDLDEWTNGRTDVQKNVTAASLSSGNRELLQYTVPDLIALSTQNQFDTYKGIVSYMVNSSTPAYSTSAGNLGTGRSVAGLVALLSQNQYNQYLRLNTLLSNGGYNSYRSSTGSLGTGSSLGNLVALVTANQYDQYLRLNTLLSNTNRPAYSVVSGSLGTNLLAGDLLAAITANQANQYARINSLFTAGGEFIMLASNGKLGYSASSNTMYTVTRAGFAGLANLLLPDTEAVSVSLIDPSDPLSPLRTDKYSSLIPLLAFMAQTEQNLLTKLQFVLANDEDIKMKQNEAPNQEAAIDGFFGSGQGAVVPTDISDTASIAGSVKSTFAGAGSAGDAFAVLNSGDTYSFFSQAVSDDLNGDPMISTHDINDDSWLEGFDVDEDGYLHLKPSSMFDVSLYLEELLG